MQLSKNAPRIAAVFILLASLPFTLLMLHAMGVNSLYNDEVYSIVFFAAKGAATTLTDYHVPNNHVLYNLFNALLPGSDSLAPLRARGPAFAAWIFCIASAVFYAARSRQYLPVAICLGFLGLNKDFLHLILQARGYGLAMGCCLAQTFSMMLYAQERRTWMLGAAAAAAVLGAWALPTYAGFGCLALLGATVEWREKPAILLALVTPLLILGLYAPLLGQMLDAHSGYGATWGRDFASFSAVGEALRVYFFGLGHGWIPWAALLLLAPEAILPYSKGAPREQAALRWLCLGGLGFFALCLVLETPPLRTAFFAGFPIFFAGLSAWRHLVERERAPEDESPWKRRIALGCCAGAALFFLALGAPRTLKFSFTPLENEQAVSRFIQERFPDPPPIHLTTPGNYLLQKHMDDAYKNAPTLDMGAFRRGELLVVENSYDKTPRLSCPEDIPTCQSKDIPQVVGGYQRILWVQPSEQ